MPRKLLVASPGMAEASVSAPAIGEKWSGQWRGAVFVLVVAACGVCLGFESVASPEVHNSKVENFTLSDQKGDAHTLYSQKDARAIVLVFTVTGCPIVQKSVPKIKQLRDTFGPKGVMFWMIDSAREDDAASVTAEARDFKIDIPILLDRSQNVARTVAASRTAEAVCIDAKSWSIFYRGAIDDQLGYGTEKRRATHPYLEAALKNFLAGKPIDPVQTEVRGCRIHFESAEK